MGKKFLRIRNRGSCPRHMLELFGATKKRDRAFDPGIIGINGSGTKYAAVAAGRLGIGIGITSSDAQGIYFVTYDEVPVVGDPQLKRIVMRYHQSVALPLQMVSFAGRNWDSPIGADSKNTFRILREYLSNAWDEDPMTQVDIVETLELAPDGFTVVYLSWHAEFDEMIRETPERWFKRLSGHRPLYAMPGVGAIYPMSDPELTRMFCQGNLAYCAERGHYPSEFDWNADEKTDLSEDKEFRDTLKARGRLNRLLCALDDIVLMKRLLLAAIGKSTSLECHIFGEHGHLGDKPPGNKDLWVQAWHSLYDDGIFQAVLSNGDHEHDQTASFSYRKKPLKVPSHVRTFLRLCGVSESKDFVPMIRKEPQYAEIMAPPPEAQQRLEEVLRHIRDEIPEARNVKFHFFAPLTEDARRQHALTYFENGKPTGHIGIQLCLAGSYTDLVVCCLHELTHVITGQFKHELAFLAHADEQRALFFMTKRGIPLEPRVDVDKQPLHPRPPAQPAASVDDALGALEISLDDIVDEPKK